MEVLVILVPLALGLGLVGLLGFLWSLRSGQYDDLDAFFRRAFAAAREDRFQSSVEVGEALVDLQRADAQTLKGS